MAKYVSEEAKKQGGKRGMSAVVGMPDDWDKRNIQTLINNYHHAHPSDIPNAIKQGRELTGMNERAKMNKHNTLGQHVMELPAPLVSEIEKAYPTMFTDKDHFNWFKKNFKSLLL